MSYLIIFNCLCDNHLYLIPDVDKITQISSIIIGHKAFFGFYIFSEKYKNKGEKVKGKKVNFLK